MVQISRVMISGLRFGVLGFLLASSVPSLSYAQVQIPGAKPLKEEPKKPLDENPVISRKIFSARLKNAQMAAQVDAIYDDLLNKLWASYSRGTVHHSKLLAQMEYKRFKYTRRYEEFEPVMTHAMTDLNKEYKDTKANVVAAQASFDSIKSQFGQEEAEAQKLWDLKMKDFDAMSKKYFKSQAEYLNIYKSIVLYFMDHVGGYYYKSDEDKLAFYKIEEYTYFGENMDKMNKIAHKQGQWLIDAKPIKEFPE